MHVHGLHGHPAAMMAATAGAVSSEIVTVRDQRGRPTGRSPR
ncbi:hypothetical protein DUI70_6698 [Streptomyces albus]|nr:hypothetical protein DUI70_6698 [Streptomyces albus]